MVATVQLSIQRISARPTVNKPAGWCEAAQNYD